MERMVAVRRPRARTRRASRRPRRSSDRASLPTRGLESTTRRASPRLPRAVPRSARWLPRTRLFTATCTACTTNTSPEALAALGDPRELAARVRGRAGRSRAALFTADFCARLLEELHRRQRSTERGGRALRRPNSMNLDGVILEEVGCEALLDDLLERVAAPGPWALAHVAATLSTTITAFHRCVLARA